MGVPRVCYGFELDDDPSFQRAVGLITKLAYKFGPLLRVVGRSGEGILEKPTNSIQLDSRRASESERTERRRGTEINAVNGRYTQLSVREDVEIFEQVGKSRSRRWADRHLPKLQSQRLNPSLQIVHSEASRPKLPNPMCKVPDLHLDAARQARTSGISGIS